MDHPCYYCGEELVFAVEIRTSISDPAETEMVCSDTSLCREQSKDRIAALEAVTVAYEERLKLKAGHIQNLRSDAHTARLDALREAAGEMCDGCRSGFAAASTDKMVFHLVKPEPFECMAGPIIRLIAATEQAAEQDEEGGG